MEFTPRAYNPSSQYISRHQEEHIRKIPSARVVDNSQVQSNSTPPKLSSKIIEWPDSFLWQGNSFIFGDYGRLDFSSKERKELFQKLTDAKGQWVKVSDLKGNRDAVYVRATIKQIEDRLTPQLKKLISIPSTQNDDLEPKPEQQGAYRIKLLGIPTNS